jgi:hypothetical protein
MPLAATGADDAAGNFTTVGDQQTLDHEALQRRCALVQKGGEAFAAFVRSVRSSAISAAV